MPLSAALTADCPGAAPPARPRAPSADGLPSSPRRARAGAPAVLDEITCQVLLLRNRDDGVALTTPAQLSAALLAALPPVPIPQLPPSPRSRADTHRQGPRPRRTAEYRSPDERAPAYRPPDAREPRYWAPHGQRPRRRSRARRPTPDPPPGTSRALVIAVPAVVLAA